MPLFAQNLFLIEISQLLFKKRWMISTAAKYNSMPWLCNGCSGGTALASSD